MLKKYLVIITALSLAGASSVFAHENERGRESRYDHHREAYEPRVIYHRLPSRFSRVIVRGAPYFYSDGVFYKPVYGGFVIVAPPEEVIVRRPRPGVVVVYPNNNPFERCERDRTILLSSGHAIYR